MEPPVTKYVQVGEADVAYKVAGDGPIDLLFSYGLGMNVEMLWEYPLWRNYLSHLASFSRLICFDRRGTGSSDRIALNATPTWEDLIEDMLAVLDDAGSERAAVLATLDMVPNAILLAAMRPERVSSLILLNGSAGEAAGHADRIRDRFVALIAKEWGTEDFVRFFNPTSAGDKELVHNLAYMMRVTNTPRTAAAQSDYLSRRDVRQALSLVQVPTLVIHVQESPLVPIEQGQYLADHIRGARLVEVVSGDISITPSTFEVVDHVAKFLTGKRPVVEFDRVLATILFTDIVGSTEQLASLGDARWRRVLDAHDEAVRAALRQFRGKEIKTTGDGFLASFDGVARAVRCAQAINAAVEDIGVSVRAGIHTGECEIRGDDLGGIAVHIAARISALATSGEILVSGTVKDLAGGSGIEFTERGEHELKGVPETWRLYAVRE